MLYRHSEKTFNDDLGMFISSHGDHVGFIYRIGRKAPRVCHLMPDGLHDSEARLEGKGLWSRIGLPDANLKFLAGMMDAVKDNKDIPYGFVHLANSLTNGIYKPMEDGFGFTCVTFMLCFLEDNAFPFVDLATWPKNRPQDVAFKIDMKKSMGQHGNLIKLNKRRVRPSEALVAINRAVEKTAYKNVKFFSVPLLKYIDYLRENLI